MMKIKTFLVDDERKSLDLLEQKIIEFCPILEIIGKSTEPTQAINLIKEISPALVFLDIAMPGMSGFELLKQFQKPEFEVIFATAFNDRAIEAINASAIGYLTKPIDSEELINTTARAQESIERKNYLIKNSVLKDNLSSPLNKRIAVPDRQGMEILKIDEIICCEGYQGYTKIYTTNGNQILSSQSIGYFSQILTIHGFMSIHKSYLINLNSVVKYMNEGNIVLENKQVVPVAKNKRKEFLAKFK